MHAVGQAEPDRPLLFHAAAKRAVVNEGRADRLDPACRFERITPHEHAASGSRGHRTVAPVRPGEGIEHLEEEDESRDEGALGEAFAAQFYHERGQHERPCLGACDEAADDARLIGNVGIGKQEIARRLGE